jgi:hypothetical protein
MQKVNDYPVIYQREDGTCVLCLAYHLEEEEHHIVEVMGTFDYCMGYYDGLSQITSGVSAVDGNMAEELANRVDSSSHECDNCGGTWEEDDLHPIKDYFERVEPGGTVPSGECPECGALCYPTTV